MNYFTRERFIAMQSKDEAAIAAADADWEVAVDQYDAYLRSILPRLDEPFRQLCEGFYLHDARVLSMGRSGDQFTVTLQLDAPPRDLLTINYTLTGEPSFRQEPFPWGGGQSNPFWLYDEVTQEASDQPVVHRVLLSNGWELDLPCQGIEISTAYSIIPAPGRQVGQNAIETPLAPA